MSLTENIARDRDGRKSTQGNMIGRCPAHEDKSRSLTFKEEGDKLLLKCWAGCSFETIVNNLVALGTIPSLTKAETYNPSVWLQFYDEAIGSFGAPFDSPNYSLEKIYLYRDEEGEIVGCKARFKPKLFKRLSYFGRDNIKLRGFDPMPYNLPEVLKALAEGRPIHQFEGEKDADNGTAAGFVTTTFGCAVDKLPLDFFPKVKGSRWVVWADNDKPGLKRAQDICAMLHNHGAESKLVVAPLGKDFSDWLAAGATIDEIRELLQETPKWLPLQEQIEAAQEKGSLPRTSYDVGTEAFAGEYVAKSFHEGLRYLCDMRRWVANTGKCWGIDVGGDSRECVKSMHSIIKRDMLLLDVVYREELEKLATKVQSDVGVGSVLRMAQTVPSMRLLATALDGPNTKHLLSCEDGVIDFKTSELLPHPQPDLLITKHSPHHVDFHRVPERFLQFIYQLFKNEETAEWVLDWLGYCLTGETSFQKFVMMVGAAGSGKSQLQTIIRLLLNSHCADLDADSLVYSKQRSAAVDSDLAGTRGCRVIFCSELSPRNKLDERVMKALTGADTIRVKFMGKDKFDLSGWSKLIFTANERPPLSDDVGIARRLLELRFENVPEVEIEYLGETLVREEGAQILGYLAQRAKKHYDNPQAIRMLPPDISGWTGEWLEEIDIVRGWVDLRTQFCKGSFETTSRLLDDLERYCKENRIPFDMNAGGLGRRLRRFGYFPDKNEMDQRGWRNVMLLP